jgi:hypothetical protein
MRDEGDVTGENAVHCVLIAVAELLLEGSGDLPAVLVEGFD